jgi:hypothetical protein
MTPEMSSADQAVVVVEKRNPEGRKRPYQVLRAIDASRLPGASV